MKAVFCACIYPLLMRYYLLLLSIWLVTAASAQTAASADSLRREYLVPGMCYALITTDSILDIQYLGMRRLGRPEPVDAASRFRIGSNTKAVTAAIAARLVQRGVISWDTEYYDLLPEMRAHSLPRYRHMTLRQLLNFEVPFPSWTYTDTVLTRQSLHVTSDSSERYAFVDWFLRHHYPVHKKNGLYQSNVSYAAAGLMLERAAQRSYPQLVAEMNAALGCDFATGEPNEADTAQTWGHSAWLYPEPPGDHYRLNWLLPAGNLNTTLPGYIRFIQALLRGDGGYAIAEVPQQVDDFKMGWRKAPFGLYNVGNPGTYVSEVCLLPDGRHALIILTNAQSDDTYRCVMKLLMQLVNKVPQK